MNNKGRFPIFLGMKFSFEVLQGNLNCFLTLIYKVSLIKLGCCLQFDLHLYSLMFSKGGDILGYQLIL